LARKFSGLANHTSVEAFAFCATCAILEGHPPQGSGHHGLT